MGAKLESVIGFCIQCFRMINMLHNEHASWVFCRVMSELNNYISVQCPLQRGTELGASGAGL